MSFDSRAIVYCLVLGLCFTCGCETTDYEPLIIKKRLQELEERIDSIGTSDSEIPDNVAERIQALEDEVSELKAANESLNNKLSQKLKKKQAELLAELENVEAYFELDDNALLKYVDLTESRYDNALLEKMVGFDSIKRLSVKGVGANEATFEIIGQMAGLERLDMERAPATPESLAHLRQLKHLKFFYLFRATLSDDSMETLSTFPALEQIRCGQTRVSDQGLAYLKNLGTLRAIDLSDCNRVSNAGLESLSGLPKLTFLKVWGPQVNDAGLEHVAKMKSLRVLGLNDTQVTDDGIAKLADLKLTEVHLFRTGVGDSGVEVLANMPTLRTLNLRDTKISDEGVGYLTRLENLAKLDLSETNSPGVTDASQEHFAKMTALKQLNLWSTKVSDDCVRGIVGLTNVTWLNLDKTAVTDEGIKLLSEMPQLAWLHIGSNSLTDGVVPTLAKLSKLTYLNVSFTKITDDGFFELDDQLAGQGCEVVAP